MLRFVQRFFGALALDPATFEEVEADRHAMAQSAAIVGLTCLAAGFAAKGLRDIGVVSFITGAVVMLCGWVVWVTTIKVIGTTAVAEPDTQSSVAELLRVMGFAAAPGVFLVLASMPQIAPLVLTVVALWMAAASVLAVRQALDYHSVARAFVAALGGWVLAMTVIVLIALAMARTVS
jgi:hypothetical protein